jgi:hypothetical protein
MQTRNVEETEVRNVMVRPDGSVKAVILARRHWETVLNVDRASNVFIARGCVDGMHKRPIILLSACLLRSSLVSPHGRCPGTRENLWKTCLENLVLSGSGKAIMRRDI